MPARTPRADTRSPGERAALVDPLRVKGPRVGPGAGAIAVGVVVLAGLFAGGYGWWRFIETDRTLVATRETLDQTRADLAEQTERGDALAADLDTTRDDLSETRLALDRSRADAEMLARRLDDLRGRFEDLERAFAERTGELGRARAELAAMAHAHALPDAPPGEAAGDPRRAEFVTTADRDVEGEVEWFDEPGWGIARFTRVTDPGAGVYRIWAAAESGRVLLGVIAALPGDGPVEVVLRAETQIEPPALIEMSYDDGSAGPGVGLAVAAEARFGR